MESSVSGLDSSVTVWSPVLRLTATTQRTTQRTWLRSKEHVLPSTFASVGSALCATSRKDTSRQHGRVGSTPRPSRVRGHGVSLYSRNPVMEWRPYSRLAEVPPYSRFASKAVEVVRGWAQSSLTERKTQRMRRRSSERCRRMTFHHLSLSRSLPLFLSFSLSLSLSLLSARLKGVRERERERPSTLNAPWGVECGVECGV